MTLRLLSLLSIALFLTACSHPAEKPEVETRADDSEIVAEQIATVESDASQSLFVYGQSQCNTQKEITLKLNAEALLLAAGYVRLAGVVSGRQTLALLEVAGAGQRVRLGEVVAGYRVIKISQDRVNLEKETE